MTLYSGIFRAISLVLVALLAGCQGTREIQLTNRALPTSPLAVAESTQLVVVVETPVDDRSERKLGHLDGLITDDKIEQWMTHALLDASTDTISFRMDAVPGVKTANCQPTLKKAYVRSSSTSVASQVVIVFKTSSEGGDAWEYFSRGGGTTLNWASTETDIRVPLNHAIEEVVEQYRADLAAKYGVDEGDAIRRITSERFHRR